MSELASKIAAASKSINRMVAEGHHKDQGYDYLTADQILNVAGDALANVGVAVIPSIKGMDAVAATYDSYGKTKTRYQCTIQFKMRVCSDDESYNAKWIAAGVDYSSPDKALYKAITSGHKYFLMKLLNIGVGNPDGEHESDTDGVPPPQKSNGQKPAPPPKENKPDKKASTIADIRADLEGKGMVPLATIADALVDTGLYKDRKHFQNAIDSADGQELREKGLTSDLRRKIRNTLLVFDWAIARKVAD